MLRSNQWCLLAGVLVLGLSILNASTAETITPSLERADVLAGMAGVGLMLVSILWTRASPRSPEAVELEGEQGFVLSSDLADEVRAELAWGSHQFLTATSAATILVFWKDSVLLRRGLLGAGDFEPGEICQRSRQKQELISLVKTALYPGKAEFDPVLPGLPSVMVQPLGQSGWVVIGGWSERCFSRSDERWLSGWAERLQTTLSSAEAEEETL
ncbi:cofactor assembly of complex C subunit CCB2 [Synechococcus sp. PROS-9-1]|uniref:cofactor assembly of complex C subunit B n=1 Tax=Synechococcus sp. PROS-9-1 TaxID=1968775 RepID=UPI00164535D8|nr:cofactor assembly of complex C subunit B [Synechococcus sp. PROS-9-1]QNJ31665.1 cofactor assembly of complex C subunit CCB2 [Synechococcus sp. PROS-9-1]